MITIKPLASSPLSAMILPLEKHLVSLLRVSCTHIRRIYQFKRKNFKFFSGTRSIRSTIKQRAFLDTWSVGLSVLNGTQVLICLCSVRNTSFITIQFVSQLYHYSVCITRVNKRASRTSPAKRVRISPMISSPTSKDICIKREPLQIS